MENEKNTSPFDVADTKADRLAQYRALIESIMEGEQAFAEEYALDGRKKKAGDKQLTASTIRRCLAHFDRILGQDLPYGEGTQTK